MSIPERQILPRHVDHAADLAFASAAGPAATFICDFRRAFMTVPASAEEARWNCCRISEAMQRERPPVEDDEPLTGCFLVWLVLGFGGKAFPLLYARVPLVLSLSRTSFGERVNGRLCVPSVPPFTHAFLPPCVN